LVLFIPEEFYYKDNELKERLIYYGGDSTFEDDEIQYIMEFKVWCLMNNQLLPDDDPEILRHLYSCNFEKKYAYDSIK
jgi:hypothetical protein